MKAEPLRMLAALLGLALATWLTTRMPDEAFGMAQAFLLFVAGALMLLAAAATLLVPARRLQGALFPSEAVDESGVLVVASPAQMRASVAPVLSALACVAVALVGAAMR